MYTSLADAYAAIAERLSGSDGDYFFGGKPSSLDALLYGHLAFHQAAPVASPEIRQQVRPPIHIFPWAHAVITFQLYSCAKCPAFYALNCLLTQGLKYWQASFCCACLLAAVFPERVMLPTDQSASCAAEVCGQDIQGCLSKARSLCIS